MNVKRSEQILRALAAAGIGDVCLCPGGRNSPLVVALERAEGFRLHQFFDERSAAFFALGRSRSLGAPVAVVTTSGTAAAELLPAAVEAHYSGTPLILVTADRPVSYRGTGAPQSIEQVGLFGSYAPTIFDGAAAGDALDLGEWEGTGPVHVNICYDEPLVDATPEALALDIAQRPRPVFEGDPRDVEEFLRSSANPLIILGPLDPDDRAGVREFLVGLGAPVYAEAASGLREDSAIARLQVTSDERFLTHLGFDRVLRVGGVPTLRLWRDLEDSLQHLPVCSVSRTPFAGLTRSRCVQAYPGSLLGEVATRSAEPTTHAILVRDRARRAQVDRLLDTEPSSEPAMIRALSRLVPKQSLVYLGNSTPIRDWDLAAIREPRDWLVGVSRGANGIDGQLSTFFGMCRDGRDNWAVLGDLTTLYDLSAPWVLPQLKVGPIRIVVINNGGGQIFSRLYSSPVFLNRHQIGFEAWARMWQLEYQRWGTVPADARLQDRVVIELCPDADATDRFWQGLDELDRA